jgi:ABC-type bacteriocin/lantibiotic exporter with double-glycine peptidase domain
MSLKNVKTFPISLIAKSTQELGGENSVLQITHFKQEQTEWCWAACMNMVVTYDDATSALKQCTLANSAFGMTECCVAPSSSLCNLPLQIVRIKSEYEKYQYKSTHEERSLSFLEIKQEIYNRRPIECGILWTGGGGHAVLITGYDSGDIGDWVYIHDPYDKTKKVTFKEFQTGFGRGAWAHSWINLTKES